MNGPLEREWRGMRLKSLESFPVDDDPGTMFGDHVWCGPCGE